MVNTLLPRPDFESNTKSYTAKVKATTGDGEDKNVEQTITVNLIDLNDETPTPTVSIMALVFNFRLR
jgi:hypothetical protein